MNRHISAVHEKRKDFNCSFCDYAAARRQNLSTPVKEVHEKIKDHECEQCDYKSSQLVNLRRHVKHVKETGGELVPPHRTTIIYMQSESGPRLDSIQQTG